MAILLCGCFCWPLPCLPCFCCFAVFLHGETQIWLGDLRVASVGLSFLLCCDVRICHLGLLGPFHSDFHCLRNCKDRAWCTFGHARGKKNGINGVQHVFFRQTRGTIHTALSQIEVHLEQNCLKPKDAKRLRGRFNGKILFCSDALQTMQ